MICWLPIQGVAGTIMLSCEEMMADNDELHHGSFQAAERDLNDIQQKQSATHKNAASSSVCQEDTICHVNCGANMSATAFSVSFIHIDSLNQLLSFSASFFIADTQYRPPRI